MVDEGALSLVSEAGVCYKTMLLNSVSSRVDVGNITLMLSLLLHALVHHIDLLRLLRTAPVITIYVKPHSPIRNARGIL